MVQHLYLGDRHRLDHAGQSSEWPRNAPYTTVIGIKGIAERLTHGGNFGVHPWDLAILALDSVQPGWFEADDE